LIDPHFGHPNLFGAWREIKRYAHRIDADAWSNKGVSFGLLGKFERAVECFETAIRIDASNAPAWYNKGMTQKVLRRNDEAETALARARELGYQE